MEGKSCHESNFPPSTRNARPGTKAVSSGKSVRSCRNKSGQFARLELAGNLRDVALFNVAIDSKLRGCDLVTLKVSDLVSSERVRERVSVIQSKTNKLFSLNLLRTRAIL